MKNQTLSVEKKLSFHKLSEKAKVKPSIKINPNSTVRKFNTELIPKNIQIIRILN